MIGHRNLHGTAHLSELGIKGQAEFEQQREVEKQDTAGKEEYFQGKASRPISLETRDVDGSRGTQKGRERKDATGPGVLSGSLWALSAEVKHCLKKGSHIVQAMFTGDVSGGGRQAGLEVSFPRDG